jgi:hypothetical protein
VAEIRNTRVQKFPEIRIIPCRFTSTAICWYMGTRYWRSITNLGIGFLLLDFQRPHPRRHLSAGVVMAQPAPKGLSPSFARRSLQAASSLM